MRTATVYNFLLEANIMASIAILLIVIVRKFFRKQLGNKAIRYAWLLVVIRLLLPISLPNPFISEIRPTYLLDEGIRPIAGQIKIRLQDALFSGAWALRGSLGPDNILTSAMDQVGTRISYGVSARVLMKYYLLGVGLVLLWFLASNVLFRWKMRAGRIEPISGELKDEFDQICKERKVKPITVYFTDPLASACLVGVFRPYIALPLSARPNEVSQVLTHEVCHLKGGDHIWSLVRLICCAVHWFNPLVWLAAWMSRTDCELACDDRVIARMDDSEKRDYASVLVLAAARRNSPGLLTMATGMTMTGKRLKDRVEGILHSGEVKRGAALAFAMLASMCLVGAFATSEVQQVWNLRIPQIANQSDWSTDAKLLANYAENAEDLNTFALGVWESPYFLEEGGALPFSIQRTESEGWRIEDAEGRLSLIYDSEGHLYQMNNGITTWMAAEEIPIEEDHTPINYMEMNENYGDWRDAYESEFLQAFCPEMIGEIDYVALIGEYRAGEDYYALFVIKGRAAGAPNLGLFAIQTEPEFRVVWLNRNQDEIDYQGNG